MPLPSANLSLEGVRALVLPSSFFGALLRESLFRCRAGVVVVACRPAISREREGQGTPPPAISPLSGTGSPAASGRRAVTGLRGPSARDNFRKNPLFSPRLLCALPPSASFAAEKVLLRLVPQCLASRSSA